jgi:hypothetical protein
LSHDKVGLLAALRRRLEAIEVEVYAVNLTRLTFGIPVTRTLAPALEMGLTAPPGPRLRTHMNRSLQKR